MKTTLNKYLALTALALAMPFAAFAQTATVSLSTATAAGSNIRTVGQSAQASTYVQNDGKTVLVVDNKQGTGVTATLVNQGPTTVNVSGYGPLTLSDTTISIPSSSIVVIGPFNINRWYAASGLVRVNFSSITSVSLSAFTLPSVQ